MKFCVIERIGPKYTGARRLLSCQDARSPASGNSPMGGLVLLSQKAAAERAENRVLEQIHSDRRGLRWVDEGRIPARHDFRLT